MVMNPRIRRGRTIGAISAAIFAACAPPECPQVSGFSAAQCKPVLAMQLQTALPASPGNAKADDDAAAWLGFKLFFDARLSANQEVRCATCHIPERDFGDGKPTSTGLETVDRNSPSIYTAARHRWQMWDGQADSLWAQPLIAFENPKEMDFTRLELAHAMRTTFAAQYREVFGALPAGSDTWPARGKPGDAAFDALPVDTQREVNRVAANVGKALEAYERKAAHGRGRFDDYLAGDLTKLSDEEQRGLRAFFKAGCDGCHSGPTLSDDAFHDVGVTPAEPGRARGLELLAASPFSAAGEFHDGPRGEVPAAKAEDEGAWRTPSLRNVARTAPYGHNGTHATLESIVDLHLPAGALNVDERLALLAFLRALDCADPPSPWNNWPDR